MNINKISKKITQNRYQYQYRNGETGPETRSLKKKKNIYRKDFFPASGDTDSR